MTAISKFLVRSKFEEKTTRKFEWNLNEKRASWTYDLLGKLCYKLICTTADMLIVMFEKQNINTVTFFVNWKECFENSLESVLLYQNGLYTKKIYWKWNMNVNTFE